MRNVEDESSNDDIIVRSLKQPTCTDISIDGEEIHYTIEKELGIELVGDVKVKIDVSDAINEMATGYRGGKEAKSRCHRKEYRS